ncbi:hypothetical protein HaLaN_19879, partial [Haematococcus lacustris]
MTSQNQAKNAVFDYYPAQEQGQRLLGGDDYSAMQHPPTQTMPCNTTMSLTTTNLFVHVPQQHTLEGCLHRHTAHLCFGTLLAPATRAALESSERGKGARPTRSWVAGSKLGEAWGCKDSCESFGLVRSGPLLQFRCQPCSHAGGWQVIAAACEGMARKGVNC